LHDINVDLKDITNNVVSRNHFSCSDWCDRTLLAQDQL